MHKRIPDMRVSVFLIRVIAGMVAFYYWYALLSSLRNLGKLNKAASCAASKRLDDVAYNLCQSAFGFTQTSVRRCNLLAAGTTCHGYNIVISLLAIIG